MSEAEFKKAAEEVKSLPKAPNDNQKLELYGLFKQAEKGDNTTTKPGMFDFVGKAKWDAWTKNKEMSKEDARGKYIALVEQLQKELK